MQGPEAEFGQAGQQRHHPPGSRRLRRRPAGDAERGDAHPAQRQPGRHGGGRRHADRDREDVQQAERQVAGEERRTDERDARDRGRSRKKIPNPAATPKVARYQSWDAPYPQEEGERFIRELPKEHPNTAGEWFQFAVALRSTGQLIGDCAAMPHPDDICQCEIGFTISAEDQGHGYATEAVRLLLTYLFTMRGKHRITANCDPWNAASIALPERLAMRREGHLREST